MVILGIIQGKFKQFLMKYLFINYKSAYYQVKVLMLNRITRTMLMFFFSQERCKILKNLTNFQIIQSLRGLCLACVTLNQIVRIKTIWLITCSTNHSVCKTSLRLDIPHVCLSQFFGHS